MEGLLLPNGSVLLRITPDHPRFDELAERAGVRRYAFDPNEARDAKGEWTSGGAAAAAVEGEKKKPRHLAKQVELRASEIEFSDETFTGESEIKRSDHEAIENAMDLVQLKDMCKHLESVKTAAIDKAMNDFDPDLSRDQTAWEHRKFQWDGDIEDEVRELVKKHTDYQEDQDAALEAVDGVNGRDEVAGDVVRSAKAAIEKAIDDSPENANEYPQALIKALDEYAGTLDKELDEKYEEDKKAVIENRRQELSDKYDDSKDKADYLRTFWDENHEQWESGERAPEDTWHKDKDGNDALTFHTDAGKDYLVNVIHESRQVAGLPSLQVTFSRPNASERFGVTGTGSAHEVFGKVTAALHAYVAKKDPPLLMFTAKEASRRRLYDKLVKNLAAAFPEYSGLAIAGDKRTYALMKRNRRDELEKAYSDSALGQKAPVETLVYQRPECLEVVLKPDHPKHAPIAQALRYAFNPNEARDAKGQWAGDGSIAKKKPSRKKMEEFLRKEGFDQADFDEMDDKELAANWNTRQPLEVPPGGILAKKADEKLPVSHENILDVATDLLHEKHGYSSLVPFKEILDRFDDPTAAREAIFELWRQSRDTPDEGINIEGDSHDEGEDAYYVEFKQRPEIQHKPAPPGMHEKIAQEFDDLLKNETSGLVPIWKLRNKIAEKMGAENARHDVLDNAILEMWRRGKIGLEGISDLGRATEQQLNDAIPGSGGPTLFYLEKPHGSQRYQADAELRRAIKAAAAETDTNPTEMQRKAGNSDTSPPAGSDDSYRALAEHYVSAWNDLERAGLEPTDTGIWKVADELSGGDWVVYHDEKDGVWKVIHADDAPKVVRHGREETPLRYEAPRLFVYRCPYCGGLAYQNDPIQGGVFIGYALCSRCGRGFSILGKNPVETSARAYAAQVAIQRYAAKRVPKGYVVNKDGRVFRAGTWVSEADLSSATPVQGTPASTGGAVAEAEKQAAYHHEKRRARGPVDRAKLAEKTVPHAHQVLGEADWKHANRTFNGLRQHHGDLTGHRIEELVNGAHEALQNVHPDDELTRERLSKRMRGYHEMLSWLDAKKKETQAGVQKAIDAEGGQAVPQGQPAPAETAQAPLEEPAAPAAPEEAPHAQEVHVPTPWGEASHEEELAEPAAEQSYAQQVAQQRKEAEGPPNEDGGIDLTADPEPKLSDEEAFAKSWDEDIRGDGETPADATAGKPAAEKRAEEPVATPEKSYAAQVAEQRKAQSAAEKPAETPAAEKPAAPWKAAETPKEKTPPTEVPRGVKGTLLTKLASAKNGLSLEELRASLGEQGQHADEAVKQLAAIGKLQVEGDRVTLPKEKPYAQQVAEQRKEPAAKKGPRGPSEWGKDFDAPKDAPKPAEEKPVEKPADKATDEKPAPVVEKKSEPPAAAPAKKAPPKETPKAEPSYAAQVAQQRKGPAKAKEEPAAKAPVKKPAESPKEGAKKHPGMMTRKEYDADYEKRFHHPPPRDNQLAEILDAMKAGYKVPEEIMLEHPELLSHSPHLVNQYPKAAELARTKGFLKDKPAGADRRKAAQTPAGKKFPAPPASNVKPPPLARPGGDPLAQKIGAGVDKKIAEQTKTAAAKKADDARPYAPLHHSHERGRDPESQRTWHALHAAGFRPNQYPSRNIEKGQGWTRKNADGKWQTLTSEEAIAELNKGRETPGTRLGDAELVRDSLANDPASPSYAAQIRAKMKQAKPEAMPSVANRTKE